MSTKKSFRDFEVYQRARALALVLYHATQKGSFAKDFALKDQITRAAGSINYNFAEGFERDGNKEFVQFLSYSKGSTGEVRAQLDSAIDRGHITPEEYRAWDEEAETIGKMLKGLMDYLKESEIRGLKFKQPEIRNQKPETRPRRSAAGAAIISVLLVLTVLTIMVVAFLQSMRIDRLTARAYLNKTKAEMIAQSGSEAAMNRVKSILIPPSPTPPNLYHATGYRNIGSGASMQTVPIISAAASYRPSAATLPTDHYLISTTTPTTAPNFTTTSGANGRPLLAEMNPKLNATGAGGWMGSPVDGTGNIVYKSRLAPWVYVLQDPTKAEQPNPAAPNYNPVIGRYAYWVDDESSKVAYSVAGNLDDGPGNAFKRGNDPRLPLDIDLGALPWIGGVPQTNDVANKAVWDFYNTSGLKDAQSLKYQDPRLINRAGGGIGSDVYNTIKYYGTGYSRSVELAGTGRKRVNLNALVTDSNNAEVIKGNMDDIAYVIAGKHLFNPKPTASIFSAEADLASADQAIPNFGARFFATGAVTTANRDLYLKKVTANIRDYIDTDSQPTHIDFFGDVQAGSKPVTGWPDGESPQVLGKEAIPFFQEHAWRGKEIAWTLSGDGSTSSYTLEFYQYFEFFNPNTKDWIAPNGTFLKAYNLPIWEYGIGNWGSASYAEGYYSPSDFEVDLSGESFPAGKVTIITTDPNPPPGMIGVNAKIVTKTLSPASLYRFTGTSTLRANVDTVSTNGVVRLDGSLRGFSQYTDYASEMVWGTPNGILDAHPYLAIAGYTDPSDPILPNRLWQHAGKYVSAAKQNEGIFYISSLRGNDQSGRSGDPRSLSEQIQIRAGSSSLGYDQTRFFTSEARILEPTPEHTLGKAQISYVNPAGGSGKVAWPDYTQSFDDTPLTSYAIIRDGPILSIGELGHVYDPRRTATSSPPNENGINYARGGGRTLKIGQNDDAISGARFGAVWQNAAWRLCDIFGVDADVSKVFLETTREGKININGILRDDGLAFKALLRRFVFLTSPNSDTNLSTKTVTDAEINNLISSIKTYLTTNGPMMERGELSQVSYFAGSSTNPLAGQQMRNINDRGREEVFRRIVELTTTRSASYRVYVIADALQQNNAGKITRLSRTHLQKDFTLQPQIASTPNAKVTSYQIDQIYDRP
jgi:four helix bundle protein